MRAPIIFNRLKKLAPRFLGAVFLVSLISACERKEGQREWTAAATPTKASTLDGLAIAESGPEAEAPKEKTPAAGSLRFMAYNVENWLTMDRYVAKKNLKSAPKPDSEKAAVIALIARHTPDIIGFCEIGTENDLAEIQENLKAAGLHLPHSHYTGGADATRHLGFLSRFPISATAKPAVVDYELKGKPYAINRGILDATVNANGKSYRFIGVHFKSKRETDDGDQAAMRLNEARLLRLHLDAIFTADADVRLIVYGDLNDTRATPAIKVVTGKYNSPTYLTAIPVKDTAQTAWTHYWALNDIYSRIDYVMVSRAMKPDVDFRSSKIIDDADWNGGSDHRPILAIFR